MEIKPHQKQTEAASDTHRFRVLNWGRKAGKTDEVIEELIAYASIRNYSHEKRPKISYIGETRKEAKRIAWDRAKSRSRHLWFKDPNESNLELYLKNPNLNLSDGNYATVYFDGWENIDALIGEEFDFLALDEVAKFKNFWSNWNQLRPTLGPRKGEAIFISRPRGMNHWYDLCNMELTNTNFKTFHASAYDNPHVDPAEIDEAKGEMSDDDFAQEYLAEFRKKSGLVYKEFDRKKHLFDENDLIKLKNNGVLFKGKFLGIDFGFTNPAALLTIARDSADCYWLLDEFYEVHKTDAQVAEYAAQLEITAAYPDPENAAGIKELTDSKVNVRQVVKGKDSIVNGIGKVRELFKAKKLRIAKHCLNTIAELESYSYPDKRKNQNESELPIDENNHALDALRYVIMMQVPKMGVTVPYVQPNPSPTMPFDEAPDVTSPQDVRPSRKPWDSRPPSYQQPGFQSSMPDVDG